MVCLRKSRRFRSWQGDYSALWVRGRTIQCRWPGLFSALNSILSPSARRMRGMIGFRKHGLAASNGVSAMNEDTFASLLICELTPRLVPHRVEGKRALLYDLSFDDRGNVAM